ncbi:hypothetical protein GC102_13275 [Paenibacillus sp. LMG 31460]|uniref:Uncharacterized protein n=1 Tax=Paenibacillus germinis TaxID=2654979 RepID=A0ABX1Z311_9BACL|nr:hypothetical protein [Paenibacillus germinis]NOU86739.1 hypothetical protein [Paenibacillus germinis]
MSHFNTIFPNVSVLASYNSLDQVIRFEELERSEFDKAIADPFNRSNVDNAALIIHETSHYIDHLATLNGQRFLLETYNAYHGILSGDEQNYWHVAKLHKAIKKLKFQDYYKEFTTESLTTGKRHSDWSFANTFGQRFDADGISDPNRPIIFNNFKYMDNFVARIPLSVEALWEANAVAAEIQLHMASIMQIKDQGERKVSEKLLENRFKEWIYTPELLTYSCATQLVSARLGLEDIYFAFVVTKALSSICLNLPDIYYHRIKMPQSLAIPAARKRGLKYSQDPSIMFYLMVVNIQESGENILVNGRVDTEKVLSINGLPSKKVLESEIESEIHQFASRKQLIGDFIIQYQSLVANGLALFRKIGIDSSNSSLDYIDAAKDTFNLCGIDEYMNEDSGIIRRINIYEGIKERLDNFILACGY